MTADGSQHRNDGLNPSSARSPSVRPGNRQASANERLREMSWPHADLGACPPKDRSRLLGEITASEFVLIIGNDLRLIPLLVDSLSQRFVDFGICDRGAAGRLGVAVGEAVVNAIVHGNLEVGSEIRDDPGDLYEKLIEARRLDPRFRKRRIRLLCEFSDQQGKISVRDEGPGFDVSKVPDPTQDANLSLPYGRGILLIRAFFDEVDYSPKGDSVTMLKRRSDPAGATRP